MKKLLIAFSVIALYSFTAKEVSFTADVNASKVHWLGKKTTGQHEGEVKLQSGKISFDNATPLNGEFVMDMNSITEADNNKRLVDHLKATDFFDVANHPSSLLSVRKFESIPGAKADAPNYNVLADLTIKGIKNEIKFPARIDINGDKASASADITIDRTKWNITYNSKSILGSTADKFIYDDITFSVKLILLKQK